jgi:hypothetical protein
MHVTIEKLREGLKKKERSNTITYSKDGRDLPFLIEPEVGECWPFCDQYT